MNGRKHGEGTYTFKNGLKYVGEYVNGKKQGRGIIYNSDESVGYDGQWKNNLPHGVGTFRNRHG